jgi:hypothetical protein
MVHVIFDPTTTRLCPGGELQSGGEFFAGRLYQRGVGIGVRRHSGDGMGDILRSIWRYLKPMATSAAKGVGKEAAVAGSRILSNLAQGASLKETMKTEGRQGVERALEAASQAIKQQEGSGAAMRRRPKRLISRRRRAVNPQNQIIVKPDAELVGRIVPETIAVKKRVQRADTLGLY